MYCDSKRNSNTRKKISPPELPSQPPVNTSAPRANWMASQPATTLQQYRRHSSTVSIWVTRCRRGSEKSFCLHLPQPSPYTPLNFFPLLPYCRAADQLCSAPPAAPRAISPTQPLLYVKPVTGGSQPGMHSPATNSSTANQPTSLSWQLK